MQPAEKLLSSLVDDLRMSPMTPVKSLDFSLQLMAWAKLSRLDEIPKKLSLFDSPVQVWQDLEPVFKGLADLKSLGLYSEIFQDGLNRLGSNIPLKSMLVTVEDAAKSGVLDNCQISLSSFLSTHWRDSAGFCIPDEVASLMIGLAGRLAKETVYCPFDQAYTFSKLLRDTKSTVKVENYTSEFLAIALINDLDIEVRFADPLTKPSYVSRGKLNQFDVAISFPPMGQKVSIDALKIDLFNRFLEPTKSGNVLNIRHILSQTKGKAIIACSQSVLFSVGAEQSMREDLLKSGVVEAVINMPPALLPFTGIPFSILVFDRSRKHDTVRFFAGDNDCFFESAIRGRSILSHWQELLDLFRNSQDEAIAVDVSVEDILANNADLSVNRYLVPPEIKAINRILDESTVKSLEEIVNIVRPLPSKKLQKTDDASEKYLSVYEFGVGAFPEFGYLSQPSKVVEIPEGELSKRDSDAFLQPHDLVIAVKGSVGKVAIAPESVPPAGDGGWMVNQSCLILRSPQSLDPRVLFMYLRSDVGQCFLNRLVSGATIPMISSKSLKGLEVMIPTAAEAKGILKTFQEQVKRQREIEALQLLQGETDRRYWSITV